MIRNTSSQVYLQEKILKLNRNNYHFMQDCKPQSQFYWKQQQHKQTQLLTQTTFLTLTPDFKFMLISTINRSIKLLVIEGRLVYNNGSTVTINFGHQSFVHHYLNTKFDSLQKKTIFAIDQSSQTLIFSAKMNNVVEVQYASKFIKLCQEEVLLRKKTIISLIAIVGVPIDGENTLMRKILIEKKKLKNRLQEVLKSPYQEESMIEQEKQDEEYGGVIFYGEGTDYVLEEVKMEEEGGKKVEGGYFAVQQSGSMIRNIKTNEYVSKRLVVKTIKDKRRNQEPMAQDRSNSIKMKKQLQIVESIKNKKYLIRYYCDIKDKDNLKKVYMDYYEHSLQEYVHYLGESIECLDKICISKQIVQAVLSLHQSSVVHRDIKPANFLIDDSHQRSSAFRIKIIDFAESYTKNVPDYKNIDYGFSHLYSPIECMEKKGFTQKGPMQGIGNKEIDYWSVGITLYEIFFRKLPVSFSKAFINDITSSWKTELLMAVNQRQKFGLNIIEDIINIICVKTMKFSQQLRMNLVSTKRILECLEKYIRNLLQILEES